MNLERSTVLEVEGIRKSFGDLAVLKGLELTARSHEVVTMIGASGSGKSTFLRCINFLELPDAGTIRFEGETVRLTQQGAARAQLDRKQINRMRSRIGMVFQSFNLFPHMTVLENCTFALKIALKTPAGEAEQTAREYLAKVNVIEQAGKYPIQLSGGQQQRVAIARALCLRPRIMLFDEPTSALDPESVGSVLRIMEDLAHTGITMICVTHEIGFARRVADRCVFMERGEIIETAPTEQFFASPRNERLKNFLEQVL